jgi:hypothetical protein
MVHFRGRSSATAQRAAAKPPRTVSRTR